MSKKNKENPNFLLYKLEPLRRLEETILSKEKIKEEYIKKLCGENLAKIFSNLLFLKEEHYLLNPDTKQKDCIADTLAFDKKNRWFVVIEYKRENSTRLYEQTQSYISCLNDDKDPICIRNGHILLDILREKEKSKKWEYDNIIWEESKGICIATEIHKDLGHHKRGEPKNKNIGIVEIKFYDFYGEKILYVSETHKLPEWLTIAPAESKNYEKGNLPPILKQKERKNEDKITNYSLNIDDIINEEWIDPEIKKILQKLNDFLSSPKKWLSWQISYNKNSYPIVYYWEKLSKQKLFTVVVKKSQINIYGNWPQEIPQNLSELLIGYGIEYRKEKHNGTGNWHFLPPIKVGRDFQNLKDFFWEYRKKFSESSEK